MMHAIALIRKSGGYKVIAGPTLNAVIKLAAELSIKFKGAYVAATIPYRPNFIIQAGFASYSLEIPFHISKGLGLELRLLCKEGKAS